MTQDTEDDPLDTAPASPDPIVEWQRNPREVRRAIAVGLMAGGVRLGAFAIGALAIGSLAIGAAAIGRRPWPAAHRQGAPWAGGCRSADRAGAGEGA